MDNNRVSPESSSLQFSQPLFTCHFIYILHHLTCFRTVSLGGPPLSTDSMSMSFLHGEEEPKVDTDTVVKGSPTSFCCQCTYRSSSRCLMSPGLAICTSGQVTASKISPTLQHCLSFGNLCIFPTISGFKIIESSSESLA